MTIRKGQYVKTACGHDGRVVAVTEKYGGRVCVKSGGEKIWRNEVSCKVIPDNEVVGDCYKCGGSGLYYMGGAFVNGVYTGQTGKCFGCEGRGKQTPKDLIRCEVYWNKYARLSV